MGIIIKFLVKNLFEKKLRTFLIILAIVLSSGVFFASMSISDSLMKMIMDTLTSSIGNAEIMIQAQQKSPSPFFSTIGADQHMEQLDYVIGQVNGNAIYKTNSNTELNVSLRGIELDDLEKMTSFTLEQESGLHPFDGNKIIISGPIAETYGLKPGDSVDLAFGTIKRKFVICGIAAPQGAFTEDVQTMNAVVPRETLASFYGVKGKVNLIFIKMKDPLQKVQIIQRLSEEYKGYRVAEPLPMDVLKSETSMISTVFMMLSCIVFFMSIFIIYTAFKVITMERLPVIGTLRSVGATRKMTDFILLAESILYGAIGGLFGCGAGVGLLYILSSFLTRLVHGPRGVTFKTTLQFTPVNFIVSFVMAVVLCFISSIVPIIKVSKIPVKDVILNMMQKAKRNGKLKLILGSLFMGISLSLSMIPQSNQMRAVTGVSGILLSMVGLLLLVPYLTTGFIFLFERAYVWIFGNIGILAAKNLRENKNIINNITMLALGISSLLMFNTAGYDSAISIVDMYKHAHYDVQMFIGRADRNMERLIRNIEGVSDVYGDYQAYNTEVVGSVEKLRTLRGIDVNRFLDYWELNMRENPLPLIRQLDEGRNILVTRIVMERYHLKVGDSITLKTKSGEKSYQVIGFFEDLMNNTDCALITDRFFKSDMQVKTFNGFYIKTSKSADEVVQSLNKEFKRWRPFVETKNNIQQNSLKNNENSMALMKGFSILALVIAVFGVINNLMISFIERKHSLAVFRSMGMSKQQSVTMMFIEALTGGLIGGGLGILGGIMMIVVLAGVNTSAQVHYPIGSFFGYMAAGAAIMLIASISPALKSSKLDIVSTIKFE